MEEIVRRPETQPGEPDPHSQRTERVQRGERMILGESGREKTQPDQGTRPPTLNGQRGIQRDGRVRAGADAVGRVI